MRASAYTKELLEEAARGARTLSEALVRLGVDPKSSKRDYIRGRMKKLGVNTSHFEREGVKWTREVLEPVVAASTSINEVVRRLGLD
ncbi:HNH endonuclease, partial [Streptomyces sp. NPDC001215]